MPRPMRQVQASDYWGNGALVSPETTEHMSDLRPF